MAKLKPVAPVENSVDFYGTPRNITKFVKVYGFRLSCPAIEILVCPLL